MYVCLGGMRELHIIKVEIYSDCRNLKLKRKILQNPERENILPTEEKGKNYNQQAIIKMCKLKHDGIKCLLLK